MFRLTRRDGRAFRIGLPVLLLLPATGEARAQSSVIWQANGVGLDAFGTSLANLGDVDGDGVPDFAVGAPQAANLGVTVGSVTVVSGANGAAILTVTGAGPGDTFGRAVATAGDMDADGV
ncbi:MAG TPA: integrin alpha, partial [Planctomycetota bacterium]|nr:integrin alpha [Planctomycetota bacterium]